MTVADYKNWDKIIFCDRTILPCDLVFMSSLQRDELEKVPVLEAKTVRNKLLLYV